MIVGSALLVIKRVAVGKQGRSARFEKIRLNGFQNIEKQTVNIICTLKPPRTS